MSCKNVWMDSQTFIKNILQLQKMNRPAFIIEETDGIGYDVAYNSNTLDQDRLKDCIVYYESLYTGRDDNIPALPTDLGTYVLGTAFGAQVKSFDDGRRYLEGPVILSAADVDRIQKPSVKAGFITEQLRTIETFVEHTKGQVPVRAGDNLGPLSVAEMLWQSEDFYMALALNPEKVHQLLDVITDFIIEYIHRMRAISPQVFTVPWPPIWMPNELGAYISDDTMSMISPEQYEEFAVTYNNRISEEFGGIYLHSCVLKENHFESIMKIKNLRSINFASQYSAPLEKLYHFFGGKVVIIPHYWHQDSPQPAPLPQFISNILDLWKPEYPTIVYVGPRAEGGRQDEVFKVIREKGFEISTRASKEILDSRHSSLDNQFKL